jgi:hypothetical protein
MKCVGDIFAFPLADGLFISKIPPPEPLSRQSIDVESIKKDFPEDFHPLEHPPTNNYSQLNAPYNSSAPSHFNAQYTSSQSSYNSVFSSSLLSPSFNFSNPSSTSSSFSNSFSSTLSDSIFLSLSIFSRWLCYNKNLPPSPPPPPLPSSSSSSTKNVNATPNNNLSTRTISNTNVINSYNSNYSSYNTRDNTQYNGYPLALSRNDNINNNGNNSVFVEYYQEICTVFISLFFFFLDLFSFIKFCL